MKKAAVVVFCALLVSCAVRQEVMREPVTEPDMEPHLLAARIHEYNGEFTSMKGSAIIVYRDRDSTLSFRCEVIAGEGMDLLRLDLQDFVFNKPLVTLVRAHDEVTAYVHPEQEYYRGTVQEAGFGSLLGFEAPVNFLFSTLLARVYIPEGETVAEQIDDSQVVIVAQQEQEVVRFGTENNPVEIEYIYAEDSGQEQVYHVVFETFDAIGSSLFPLTIKVKSQNRTLEIRYSAVELNVAISEKLFLTDISDMDGYTRRLW